MLIYPVGTWTYGLGHSWHGELCREQDHQLRKHSHSRCREMVSSLIQFAPEGTMAGGKDILRPFCSMWQIDLQTAVRSSDSCPRFRASRRRAKNTGPRLAYSGILPEARIVVAERALQRLSWGALMADVGQQMEVMQYH